MYMYRVFHVRITLKMLRAVIVVGLISTAWSLTANEKLKKCCGQLKKADKECVERFCDFNAISQANVSIRTGLY